MACKSCGSEKQRYFSGELSVAFLAIEKLKQAPVYVVQKILVCLDCGYAEIPGLLGLRICRDKRSHSPIRAAQKRHLGCLSW